MRKKSLIIPIPLFLIFIASTKLEFFFCFHKPFKIENKKKKKINKMSSNNDAQSMTKDLSQAIETANQSLEYIWSTIASTAREMGSTSITNCAASRALSYNPQNRKALEAHPTSKNGTAFLFETIQQLLLELQANPNSIKQWSLLGKCYLCLSDFTNAYSSFGHVLRLINSQQNFDDIYFWYSIACVYQHFGYNQDALKFFQTLQSILENSQKTTPFPLISDFYLRLGLLQRSLGNYKESIDALEYIKKTKSQLPPALTDDDIAFHIAFTGLYSQKTETKAFTELRNLINKYPKNLKLIQQFTWAISFKTDEALLKEAKQLIDSHQEFKDDPLLNFITARILLKTNDIEAAYAKFSACISDWAESPVFWCSLGVLYMKHEQKQDALLAFQRAILLKPEMDEAWLNLGMVFEIWDNSQNAVKIYEAGKQNCPQSRKLQERLTRLSQGQRNPVQRLEIEEVGFSKFFTQIGDAYSENITRTPPSIPGSSITSDESKQQVIESLRLPYDSLFADS